MRSHLARLLAVCMLLVVVAAPATPADDAWKAVEDAVGAALDAKEPEKRAQAFVPLEGSADPRAVGLIVRSVRKVGALVQDIRKKQATAEAAYEKSINQLQALEDAFAAAADESVRATEMFNKRERRISRERDAALGSLRTLENDYVRVVAVRDAAVQTMAKVLGNMASSPHLPKALDELDRAWLRSPDPVEAVRYVDAVKGLEAIPARDRLRAAATDTKLPARVRGAAVEALADAQDPSMPATAVANLGLGPADFVLVSSSIAALRSLHHRDGIEPLIDFLGRQDIGRLRTDAHVALRSLTGQTHGPFREPWQAWWKEHGAAFAMPERTEPTPAGETQGKEVTRYGVEFYGITTFSTRVVFVMDVSGSMDKPNSPPKPQPSRLAAAKKELVGCIHNVGDGHFFNVLLFNHELMPWQPAMTLATKAVRDQAETWVEARHPVGATNIHDALEAAFTMAIGDGVEPAADTIFFLTDGTPTAGKLQEPHAILEAVRDWNRTLRLTVHCIALGEADHVFLRALATSTGGQFIQR